MCHVQLGRWYATPHDGRLGTAKCTSYGVQNEDPYLERLFISLYGVDVKKPKWYLEISCFVLSPPPYAWGRVLLWHQVFVLRT